jgi:hypothetical protein
MEWLTLEEVIQSIETERPGFKDGVEAERRKLSVMSDEELLSHIRTIFVCVKGE